MDSPQCFLMVPEKKGLEDEFPFKKISWQVGRLALRSLFISKGKIYKDPLPNLSTSNRESGLQ